MWLLYVLLTDTCANMLSSWNKVVVVVIIIKTYDSYDMVLWRLLNTVVPVELTKTVQSPLYATITDVQRVVTS